MEIVESLNGVLKLLDAAIVKYDGRLYICDTVRDKTKIINRKDGNNYFEIKREDGSYHIDFNREGFSIKKGNETLSFSANGATYTDREDNSRYNKTFVHITSMAADFYEREGFDDGYLEESIKTHSNGKYLKNSRTLCSNGVVIKEDVYTKEDNDRIYLTQVNRKYNERGSLVIGSEHDEEILIPVDEYVYGEMLDSDIFRTSFDKFNKFINGVGLYFADSNELLKRIISEDKKTTK